MKHATTLTMLTMLLAQVLPAETVWVRVEQADCVSPRMVSGNKQGLQGVGALGDFLVPTMCSSADKPDIASFAKFAIEVREAGTYCVWARVRYPMATGESFGFVIGEKSDGPVLALGDSGQVGREWRWDSQGTGRLKIELKPGRFTFCITARQANASVYYPSRWLQAEPVYNPWLNLLCLTTKADYVPTDEDACRALGIKQQRDSPSPLVAPVYLPSLSPEQWSGAGRQPVPGWLRCARWFTKDSWRQEFATRAPGDIEKLVRQVAACHGNVLRISVLLGGNAFYQSRVAPHMPGLGKLDYLREAMDAGRRYGVKIVVYVWPWGMCEENPSFKDCVIRDPDGSVPKRAEYKLCEFDLKIGFVCPNAPAFRKFYRDVLTEIFTEYKPDGMYVDGLTPNFCFCPHCQENYREMFQTEMPAGKISKFYWPVTYWGALTSAPYLIGDPHDPDAHRFTSMIGKAQTEITQLFTETVKRCKPDAATTYHSYPKSDNVQLYDGTLTEIYPSRPWVHTAWNFGEVANYSTVFPVPVMSNVYPHDHCIASEARCKALQALANGTFPNYSPEARANALVNNADSFLALHRLAAHPNLYCCLDVMHMAYHREDLGLAIEKLGDKLLVFQLCDARSGNMTHFPIGEGAVKFDDILGALKKIKFQGYLVAEIYKGGKDTKAQVDGWYREAQKLLLSA